jgi:alpha-glucosidase
MLVAFNLSGQDVAWSMDAHKDASVIGDHGLASGRIESGTLHLPARGVFFAKV